MANEFQLLPNPTNVPEAVSTGYQRQNTNLFALTTGLDTTNPRITNNENTISITAGGIVESNGSLFKLVNDTNISIPNVNNDYFISVHDNGNGTANLQLSTVYPTYIISKNGWYTSNNERVLDNFYMRKIFIKRDINNNNIGAITFMDLQASQLTKETLTNLSETKRVLAAATLGNGSVLFGGGQGTSAISAIVDKYDTNNVRTTITSLSQARSHLAAATLGNGSVLFGGGSNGNTPSAVVDRYDTNNVRTTITSLSEARNMLAAAALGNGSVLFGGGQGTAVTATVDKYDTNNVRTTLTSLSEAKYYPVAATLGNSSVLFGGGCKAGSLTSATVDKYDTNNVRTTLTSLSVSRYYLGTATLGNGSVLFGGGSSRDSSSVSFAPVATVDKYDTNNVRTTITSLSQARQNLAATALSDGSVLFGGGSDSVNITATVERYDTNNVRSTITSLSVARMIPIAVTLGDGSALFGGGEISGSGSAAVDKYSYTVSIILPYYSIYRFNDDTEEKMTTTQPVKKSAPNRGYIRYNNNSVSV